MKVWQIGAVVIALIVAIIMAVPYLRETYTGVVLSGRCGDNPRKSECDPPYVPGPFLGPVK